MRSYLKRSLRFFLFLAVFWAVPGYTRVLDRTLVTVNDDIILESDLEKFQRKLKSKSFAELFGGVDTKAAENRDVALQLLIEEKLMNQQVKKGEMQATPQEVDGQIRSILRRNGVTEKQLTERLKQLGSNMQEYREGIQRQIERRNLIDREIKPALDISDEQLRHFYLRNKKGEDSETQYHIAHILITPKDGDWKAGQARAQAVYDQVKKNPENFEKIVKETSDDTSTTEVGGVLGYFAPGALAKEFRSTIPKTASGGITAPIQTKAGYHIVKVLDTRSGDFANLSKDRKEALKNQMAGEEMERKMAVWLERKKHDSHIKMFHQTAAAEEKKPK